MVNFYESRLDALAIHRIGLKPDDAGVELSKTLFPLDLHDITDPLQTYFVGNTKFDTAMQFYHRSNLEDNAVYTIAKNIFAKPSDILSQSTDLAKYLYEKSTHPKIKAGDFFVCFWYDVIYEDQLCNAIGIFKAENRDTFFRTSYDKDSLNILPEEGINIHKLDKGCIILDIDEQDGYRCFIVDNQNKGTALYWSDEFLQVQRVHDSAFHTSAYLQMTHEFCEEKISKDTNRKEQVDFINKSVDFFNKKEQIDWNEFTQEVIEPFDKSDSDETPLADEFDRYKAKFEVRNAIEPQNGFEVNRPSVAKSAKKFKTQITLDTEITLKIKPISEDADNPFVERGYDDEKGMHYYKVYFNHES
jgi:hypothetical protein